MPNVLVTAHQAWFTQPALNTIAETTISNLTELESSKTCANVVQPPSAAGS